jgi:putative transposase
MREQGLAARRKKRRATTRPGKGRWRAPDLVKRDFPAQKINTKWYGDGTEIPTDQGKLYLASVMDMASRRVLGFALGEHHDAQLAYSALVMAVAVRGGQVCGVIMHTDQGSEGGFNRSSQHCLVDRSIGTYRAPRPGSSS